MTFPDFAAKPALTAESRGGFLLSQYREIWLTGHLWDIEYCLLEVKISRTSNLRITHADLRITYAELRRCMWNFCGINAEFRNALRNSAKVSQHAEFVPHPTSEYFPHLYGIFAENSDLVFLHSGTMRKIST